MGAVQSFTHVSPKEREGITITRVIFNELAKDCAYSENNISLLQGLIGGKMYLYTELPTPGEAKAKAMPGRLYIHT